MQNSSLQTATHLVYAQTLWHDTRHAASRIIAACQSQFHCGVRYLCKGVMRELHFHWDQRATIED